jgi:hypothetical protein
MAEGTLSAPGSKEGPCKHECAHPECTSTRLDAASVCRYCKAPIGYEARFYHEGSELVHAICLEAAVEAEQAES